MTFIVSLKPNQGNIKQNKEGKVKKNIKKISDFKRKNGFLIKKTCSVCCNPLAT